MQSLNLLNFNIGVGQALWAAFWTAVIIVSLTSLAFYYHWGRFSPSHIGALLTIIVYTLGTAALFLAMLGILISL